MLKNVNFDDIHWININKNANCQMFGLFKTSNTRINKIKLEKVLAQAWNSAELLACSRKFEKVLAQVWKSFGAQA